MLSKADNDTLGIEHGGNPKPPLKGTKQRELNPEE